MIRYKISNTPVGNAIPRSHDIQLYDGVDSDYRKYVDAPRDYQIRYDFIFHALYSCLIKCNDMTSKEEGLNKFKEFVKKVEEVSSIRIKPIKEDSGTISFVVDYKDKVKRYK